MEILKLFLTKQPYCPEIISQFYCTVRFKDDSVRSMTWMCGDHLLESNLSTFGAALGYTWDNIYGQHGLRVHSVSEYAKEMLVHCYPPEIENPDLPFIITMYPFYNLLTKIFHENI